MSARHLKARKLQPFQVTRIRQMFKEGFQLRTLAGLFGLSHGAIFQIVRFRTYKDVK
jgi:hypothetical protein